MLSKKDFEKIKAYCPGYVDHWIYTEHGRPILLVVRYERNGKKTYRQFHCQNNEWIEGMPQAPYPLFGLETLKHASPFGGPVICEGEKCAKALQQLGWPSLAIVLGASNVSSSDLTPLRHFKRFLILRDNDKAGIEFCRKLAVELRRLSSDVELSVCNLTPDIPGGDVIDWIQQKPLYGQSWNGFHGIPFGQMEHVARCLTSEIEQLAKPIEDLSEIDFHSSLCLFEGEPRQFQHSFHPVPLFPVEILPMEISRYLQICARQFCLPSDFAGTVLIALTAGVIGRSIRLDMREGQN